MLNELATLTVADQALNYVMTNTGGSAKTTCSVTDFTADRAKVPCSALAQLCNRRLEGRSQTTPVCRFEGTLNITIGLSKLGSFGH